MSPVQSVVPGMGMTPWPIQNASRPASKADPELVVFDPLLLLLPLLLDVTPDGNNSPPWPPIVPELVEADPLPPLPFVDEDSPDDEQAAGSPKALIATPK